MKSNYSVLILLLIGCSSLYSQLNKCRSDTLCYAEYLYPSNFPIQIEQRWESESDVDIILIPFSYDINNDCKPELIAETNINGEAAMVIIDSKTGETIKEFLIPYLISRINSFAIADVNSDGIPEIFLVTDDFGQNPVNLRDRLVSIDLDGNINWISNVSCKLNFINQFNSTPSLADFNQDGVPEIYVNNMIFNSLNGNLLVEGGQNGLGGNISITKAAQLDDDTNDLELAAGYTIYKVQINNINDSVGNAMIPMNIDINGVYYDGYTTIGDINLDGKLDVVVSSTETAGQELLYAYSIINNSPELIAQISPPGSSVFMGAGTIGLIDDTNTPTILVHRPNRMFAYQFDGSSTLSEKWVFSTEDNSGTTGITLYDLNNDNINEIILRDEQSLKIIDGAGASPLLITEEQCTSPTILEYPIVSDIDNNGRSEICIPCEINGIRKLVAFGSPDSLPGWTPARGIWNQYNYNVTNINDDGTVPQYMENNATYEGGRYNNFYQQATVLDSNGMYRQPAVSLLGAITCINYDTASGQYVVTFDVTNQDQASKVAESGIPIAFYNGDPETTGTLLGVHVTSSTIQPGETLSGLLITLTINDPDQLFLVVNTDRGTSGPYADEDYQALECDYTDNIFTTTFPPIDTLAIAICEGDVYDFYGASLDDPGDYFHKFTNMDGCDSVVSLLLLDIQDTIRTSQDTTVCDGYIWNGLPIDSSGIYSNNAQSMSGCDSISTLQLIVNRSDQLMDQQTACGFYNWNGVSYTETGLYPFQATNRFGCDSTITLDLQINPIDTIDEVYATCISYTWNGSTYDTSGLYTTLRTNQYGCDSLVRLDLTINDSIKVKENFSTCDSFIWNGEIYTSSGTFTHDSINAVGCDSITELTLNLNYSQNSLLTSSACDSFMWNGTNYTSSGLYNYETQTSAGCDSIAMLDLEINASSTALEVTSACDSFIWQGITYTDSGEFAKDTMSVFGCDSVLMLDLTIHREQSYMLADSACGSYLWNGEELTQSNTYTLQLQDQFGCDSTINLDLVIFDVDADTIALSACDSVVYEGQVLDEAGMYDFDLTNINGCDSTVSVALELRSDYISYSETACDEYLWPVNGSSYSISGIYKYPLMNAAGCDSIHFLDLTINTSSQENIIATTCDSFYWNANNTTYEASGAYTTILQTQAGCDSTLYLQLDLSQSVLIVDTISTNGPYLWEVNNEEYTASGNYSAAFTTMIGCDSIRVLNLRIDQYVGVFFPNIFRPDGLNNAFTIHSNGILSIASLTVFDKWGNKMFDAANIEPGNVSQGWDGRFNGREVDSGVYVWEAKLVLRDGTKITRVGDVTVIR